MRTRHLPIETHAAASRRAQLAASAPTDYLSERALRAAHWLAGPDQLDPATGLARHALARGAIEAERLRLKIVFAQAGPRFAWRACAEPPPGPLLRAPARLQCHHD